MAKSVDFATLFGEESFYGEECCLMATLFAAINEDNTLRHRCVGTTLFAMGVWVQYCSP